MKASKIIFLLTVFCSHFIFGQSSKDSLLQVIKNHKVIDTIQCDRLLSFIDMEEETGIWKKYNDLLFKYANNKLKTKLTTSEIKKYNYFIGHYFNNNGYYFVIKKEYKNALLNYQKAVIVFKKIKDLNSLALVYQNIGTQYDSKGETANVLLYYNKVLKLKIQTQDSIGISNIYADLGRFFGDNGSETKALEYFRRSLKISENLKDEPSINRTKKFMLIIYTKQKEYDYAIELLRENLKYYKKINNPIEISGNYHNMAFVYNELNEKKLMNTYNDLSLKIALKNNLNNHISLAYAIKREFYVKTKQIDSAYKYSKLEYKYSLLSVEEPYHTKSKIQLSNIYKLKKEFKNAELMGIDAYNKAYEMNYPELIMLTAKNLKEIYLETNNNPNALKYAQIEIKMKDSLNSVNTKNSAIKSLFKYETEKKEAKINELNQKKKITELQSNKKTILINSFIISFLALAIIAYFLFSRYKTQKKNELLETKLAEAEKLLEAEKKATDSELKALKSQMNPHFIFNALNSIQEQFMYGDKLKGNEQLSNFTYLTRQILEVSGKKQITIATEIDILTKYLDLEKMRFAKDFEYTISTSNAIDEDYHKLPPMLLQPFVENSIKHGLMHKKGLKTININFDLNENEEYIICTLIDNGIGRQKSAEIKANNQVKHNSFSTQSISERLMLLNENLKLKNLITYSDGIENDVVLGTKVIINIPIV